MWAQNRFLCHGIDPVGTKLPPNLLKRTNRVMGRTLQEFGCNLVEATADTSGAFKPNFWFWASKPGGGLWALEQTVHHAHEVAPEIPVIIDLKGGDVKDTLAEIAELCFVGIGADAITINPYMGREAFADLLAHPEWGFIAVCRTSNPGSDEFQTMETATTTGTPLYVRVAEAVDRKWNTNGNCMLVMGATYPEDIPAVRKSCPKIGFLIPGIGKQGGALEESVAKGLNDVGAGIYVNASGSLSHASSGDDYAEAARREALKLHEGILAAREVALAARA